MRGKPGAAEPLVACPSLLLAARSCPLAHRSGRGAGHGCCKEEACCDRQVRANGRASWARREERESPRRLAELSFEPACFAPPRTRLPRPAAPPGPSPSMRWPPFNSGFDLHTPEPAPS